MKTLEFLLLIFCVLFIGKAMAAPFTTQTGYGDFIWNGQVMSHYSFSPGFTFNLVNGVTAQDTNEASNDTINQAAFNSYICNRNGTSC